MNISFYRMRAILIKEYYDMQKNANVLIMAALPIVYALIFRGIGSGNTDPTLLVVMSLTTVATFNQALLLAEEKEKHTLRVLMLSPTSALEVLVGKGIITFLTSLTVCLLSVEISDRTVHHYLVLVLLIVLTTIFFIGLGTLIGLISRNVTQASVYGFPLFFLFTFGPLIDIPAIVTVLEWLPSQHLIDGMNLTMASGLGNEIYSHFLIIGAWTVAILLICMILYKKKKFDEN